MFLRIARLVPANGIAFVVLVAIAALLRDAPDREASDAEWVAYFTDADERRAELLAFFLIGLSVLCFLSWLGSLRGFLARAEGEPTRITAAAISAGSAFIALAAAGHAVGTSPSWAVEAYEQTFRVDANLVRLTSSVEYALFVMSLFAASAMALAASIVALHSRVFPTWLAVLGFLASVAGLLGFLIWPSVVILAWILAVSLVLLFPRAASSAPPPA